MVMKNPSDSVSLAFAICLLAAIACHGQDVKPSPATAPATRAAAKPAWPVDKPSAPAVLPGNGLAQHDFFYAGEAKTQDMYIVRQGRVEWSYHDSTTKGEISDAVLMSNGNIVFAHQFGVTLITPEKKVLWKVEAPPKHEIHTAQPIGKDRVVYVQNGEPALVIVVNVVTGAVERQFEVPVKNPKSVHGHFRHARLTDAGTLLIAHMDMGKAVEYDEHGKVVWSIDAAGGVWSAVRLKNGNTLLCGSKYLREVNPANETVWEFTPANIPEYRVAGFQIATRLSNGNTLFNNWVNQWSEKIDPATAPVQAWEVTPDKQLVWALRSWVEPAALGPSTVIQLLDEPGVMEDVHFGSIR